MNIQGYQRMTLLDFPGCVACTVFTGGCNYRCPFCHNAPLVLTPSEYVSSEKEVLSYLEQRKKILDGVCITGGEPLMQPDLAEFIIKIRAMGYKVKLDTNGSFPFRLEALIRDGLLDYIAMDIKSSFEGYDKAIGCTPDIEKLEKSIDLIMKCGVDYEFRTTAVKGIQTLSDFVAAAKRLTGTKRYFIQDFVDSGNLIGSGFSAFSDEEITEVLNAVKKYVPCVELRGRQLLR